VHLEVLEQQVQQELMVIVPMVPQEVLVPQEELVLLVQLVELQDFTLLTVVQLLLTIQAQLPDNNYEIYN
tara:strand:- start:112 stop:321 length:210 start_codon:yes stop_codon:yes gene_type:complete